MANYTTTEANKLVKETLDAVIQESYDDNMVALKHFKKYAPSEGITPVGRYFTIKTNSNESYGMPSEGGAFPAAGKKTEIRPLVNYRSQFKTFGFTGDVEDIPENKILGAKFADIVKDSTESFDAQQDYWLFGSGDGSLGQIDSVSSNAIAMLNSVTYPQGARPVRAGQTINAYDVSGTAYRSGDMVVSSVTRATDIVNVDAAAAAIASDDDDLLVFKSGYNGAPQGFKYHIDDSGTWLTITRSSSPSTKALVYDAASASVDWDMIETADLRSRNLKGDAAKKYGSTLFMHPCQHKALRASARSAGGVMFNGQLGGNKNMDLLVQDITPGGQTVIEDTNCGASDIFGVILSDWAIEEVAPRQLYKHNDGNILIQQIASSTAYGDAKEGRVYWRYNFVCKRPSNQYRIKNVNFSTSDTRIQRG
jgi:hypothetical protein